MAVKFKAKNNLSLDKMKQVEFDGLTMYKSQKQFLELEYNFKQTKNIDENFTKSESWVV